MRLCGLLLFLAGCGSVPGPTGRAYHDYFMLQRLHPEPSAAAQARPGLDSQEAAIISATYRTSLAPKEVDVDAEEQVLIVAPPMKGSPAP